MGCAMINEERVKELFQMAVYDEYKEKENRQMGEYYMWDYVGKEVVKSFFSGTIAFILLGILWGIGSLSSLTEFLGSMDFADLAIHAGVLYIGFMAVYLLVTVLVYCVRYVYGRKELRRYVNHLKNVRRLYQQEDKHRS
jgi:hypothetical protein